MYQISKGTSEILFVLGVEFVFSFFRKKIDDALVPGWSWKEGRDRRMVKYKTGLKMCAIKMSNRTENESYNGEADLNAWNFRAHKNYFVSLDINRFATRRTSDFERWGGTKRELARLCK